MAKIISCTYEVLLAAVNPEKGFTNAMDLAYELENGLARGTAVLPMESGLSNRANRTFDKWFN